MLQLKRETPKKPIEVPLDKQIEDLEAQLKEKNAEIEALKQENISTVATLLDQDMRIMDIELQLGV